MASAPSIGTQLVMRLESPNTSGSFGVLASAIGDAGGMVGAVDTRTVGKTTITRDVTVNVPSELVGDQVRAAIENLEGTRIVNVSDSTFLAHLGGKIRTGITRPVKTRQDLSTVYTPGVARVSSAIAKDPNKAYALTIKRNTVCVLSDGTSVLGLGDIGPYGAAPVMEGKCMLFKQFADIDAFPICLDTKDVDEIVRTAKLIAPIFGGINLEDISAPRCFEVERRLVDELDIPVMHDDQHGTAVVILAALMNAVAAQGKELEDVTLVLTGRGGAGRRRDGHGAQRLSQPDQQPAVVPRHLPGRARLPRPQDHRGDEARGGARDRGHRRRRAQRGVHRPERVRYEGGRSGGARGAAGRDRRRRRAARAADARRRGGARTRGSSLRWPIAS